MAERGNPSAAVLRTLSAVFLLTAIGLLGALATTGSVAGASVGAKKKPKSTTTAKASTTALTVDACKLLTDAEVAAYVNSVGGTYKAQLPFQVQAAPATTRSTAPDPAKERFCTWGFDQATGSGSTSNDGHVALSVERLTANQLPTACSLTSSSGIRNLTGIGDKAQTTNSAVLGCVLVGNVKVSIAFDGAEENGTAPGDGVIDATLRQLASRVGRG